MVNTIFRKNIPAPPFLSSPSCFLPLCWKYYIINPVFFLQNSSVCLPFRLFCIPFLFPDSRLPPFRAPVLSLLPALAFLLSVRFPFPGLPPRILSACHEPDRPEKQNRRHSRRSFLHSGGPSFDLKITCSFRNRLKHFIICDFFQFLKHFLQLQHGFRLVIRQEKMAVIVVNIKMKQ